MRLSVFDSSNKLVAIAEGEMFKGFSNDKFAYETLPSEDGKGTANAAGTQRG
jgi:hypothetical protein